MEENPKMCHAEENEKTKRAAKLLKILIHNINNMVVLDIVSGVTKSQTVCHISKVILRAQKHIVQLTTILKKKEEKNH